LTKFIDLVAFSVRLAVPNHGAVDSERIGNNKKIDLVALKSHTYVYKLYECPRMFVFL
jgi:hypothetical protein